MSQLMEASLCSQLQVSCLLLFFFFFGGGGGGGKLGFRVWGLVLGFRVWGVGFRVLGGGGGGFRV